MNTQEAPFSDMADYEDVARRFILSGDLSHNGFWKSYKPPGLPVLLGVVKFLVPWNGSLPWSVFQSLVLFVGCVLVGKEVGLLTKRRLIGLAIPLVVGCCQASVFWSLKISTEGLTESLLFLCLGLWLVAQRTGELKWYVVLGGLSTTLMLTRPQAFLVVFFFALLLGAEAGYRLLVNRDLIGAQRFSAFIITLMLVWSPWLLRSYSLYGGVVPFSTQGPYSFLWELGYVPVPDDSSTPKLMRVQDLQVEATRRFENDYQASRHAQGVVLSWLGNNLAGYPELVLARMERIFSGRSIHLTRVSREVLVNRSFSLLLWDKSWTLGMLGILGLCLMSLLYWRLIVFPASFLSMWLVGGLFMGVPRLLEPVISLLGVGVLLLFLGTLESLKRVWWWNKGGTATEMNLS